MTIEELHNKLVELGISPDRYYLHGLYGSTDDNEKVALTIRRGKYTIEYETYFKERGQKHSIKIFTDEKQASEWVLRLLTYENDFLKEQKRS